MADTEAARSAMTLQELLERVEKAEVPDRELDAALWAALWHGKPARFEDSRAQMFYTHFPRHAARPEPEAWHNLWRTEDGTAVSYPSYTSSLDAAIALVEKKFPNAEFSFDATKVGVRCDLAPLGISRLLPDAEMTTSGAKRHGGAAIPAMARALISALLKALIVQ